MRVPSKTTANRKEADLSVLTTEEAEKIKSVRYVADSDVYEVNFQEGYTPKRKQTERWRLMVILDEMDLLDKVEQVVSKADKRTKIAWKNTSVVNRDSKAIRGIKRVLKLTDEQVDEIFIQANEIDI